MAKLLVLVILVLRVTRSEDACLVTLPQATQEEPPSAPVGWATPACVHRC